MLGLGGLLGFGPCLGWDAITEAFDEPLGIVTRDELSNDLPYLLKRLEAEINTLLLER